MLRWTHNAAHSIKVRLLFWAVWHTCVLLNVLVVNVHPFVFGSALEYQTGSFFWVCLEVALTVRACVQVFIENLTIVAFVTFLFVVVKVFVSATLNALLSNWERLFDSTFWIKRVFGLFIDFLLDFRVSFCAWPVGILQVGVERFLFAVIGSFVEESIALASSTSLLRQGKQSSFSARYALIIVEVGLVAWADGDFICVFEFLVVFVNVVQGFIIRYDKRVFPSVNVWNCNFRHCASVCIFIEVTATIAVSAPFGLNVKIIFAFNALLASVKRSFFRAEYCSRGNAVFIVIKRFSSGHNDFVRSRG